MQDNKMIGRFIQLLIAGVLFMGFFSLSPGSGQGSEPLRNLSGNPHPAKPNGSFYHRLAGDLEHAIAKGEPVLSRYGYPAIFLAVLVEGVGIPAPGQTLVITGAVMAARNDLWIGWVLAWAVAAAVLGNSLGYLLGKHGGRFLLVRLKVIESRLARMEGIFQRYGKGVILIARFVDGLRQLNGWVAGMLRMPWWLFTLFNVLGAVLWVGVWGLGTYYLDKDMDKILLFFHQAKPWDLILTLTGILALAVYLFWRRRAGNRSH